MPFFAIFRAAFRRGRRRSLREGCLGSRLSYGGVSLDTGTELFLRSPKIVLSAERIMERVWGWDSDAGINVVWVHISNLRKRLKAIGAGVTIQANRGLGYILEAER